jgi:hypothetical protein
MRTMMAAALMLAACPAMAQTVCVKPPVPDCLQENQTYVAADRLMDCQNTVHEYIDRTMDYVKCLNNEVTATGQEMNRNIDRFNCRLAARNDCR